MTTPYTARIMLLIDSEWIEFKRFHRQIFPHDLRSWTINLSAPWRIERTLSDRECLSSRPSFLPYHARRATIKLTPEERDTLAARGWEAEYKVSP